MKTYATFQEAEGIGVPLFYEQKHPEAIEFIKTVLNDFPEMEYELNWSLALHYCMNRQYEESLDLFESSLAKGIFFPFPPEFNIWESLEKYAPERFARIKTRSLHLREQAQVTSRPKVEVVPPVTYNPGKKKSYPLFIILPGWGGDNEFSKRHWVSERLGKEFITAYIHSSQVVKTRGFAWDDLSLARKEIQTLVEQILRDYAVDPERIFIGGYSQGGKMALEIVFSRIIPIKGFVLVCPGGGIPASLNKENAAKAVEKGVRGYIITSERDDFLPEQQEAVKILQEAGLSYSMTINPGMYHWFPGNFSTQLDIAIEYITT